MSEQQNWVSPAAVGFHLAADGPQGDKAHRKVLGMDAIKFLIDLARDLGIAGLTLAAVIVAGLVAYRK